MKTSPVRYFGSPYRTSRIMRFAQELANVTGKGENDFLFIEPYSIGDALHTLGLLPRFREIYCEPGQRIILLCQERSKGLNEIMPFADVVVGGQLTPYEIQFEYLASLSNGLSPHLPIICPPDMHALGKVGRTGVDPITAKRSIFFLEQHEPWQGPIISASLRAATEQRLAALGLRRGEGLVIIPHAMTFNDLPPEFWQAAVLLLRERFPHLHLFTETTGGRAPIEGTQSLALSLAELIPAVEFAGAALAVRSGLVDILAHAQADIVSMVPPTSLHKAPPASFRQEEFFVRAWFPDATVADVAVRELDLEALQAVMAAFGGAPAPPAFAEAG